MAAGSEGKQQQQHLKDLLTVLVCIATVESSCLSCGATSHRSLLCVRRPPLTGRWCWLGPVGLPALAYLWNMQALIDCSGIRPAVCLRHTHPTMYFGLARTSLRLYQPRARITVLLPS